MRVLMICDDYWHPGQICIDGTAQLAGRGFQIDTVSEVIDINPGMFADYSAVILCKSCEMPTESKEPPGSESPSWYSDELQNAFVNYVESGGGLLAIHSGIVLSKQLKKISKLLGCRFTFHPNACPVTVQPIKPHPVTDNVGMFCEIDEHYRVEILMPDVDILIASYAPQQGESGKFDTEPYHNTPACLSASGFVRTQGKGRVCVLTPGHNLPVWLNQNFRQTLENALLWCASSRHSR